MLREVVTSCVVLLGVSVLASNAACGYACTAVGCLDGVEARLELPRPLPELTGARINVCRGDNCTVRPLVPPCVGPDGSLAIYCYREFADRDRDDVITVSTFVPEPETMVDGEVFTFFITDAAGLLIAQHSGPARYADRYPNGPDCGAACRQARLN